MDTVTAIDTVAAEDSTELNLGQFLGRQQAFNVVATFSEAGFVECVRQIRDRRLYKAVSADFDSFCATRLGASRPQVNRVISYLEKFGPRFFALSKFARISPAMYQAIEPHLSDGGLTLDGETFALSAENAEKVAAAIGELRRRAKAELAAAAPPAKTETVEPSEAVIRGMLDVIPRFAAMQSAGIQEEQRSRIGAILQRLIRCAAQLGIQAIAPESHTH